MVVGGAAWEMAWAPERTARIACEGIFYARLEGGGIRSVLEWDRMENALGCKADGSNCTGEGFPCKTKGPREEMKNRGRATWKTAWAAK